MDGTEYKNNVLSRSLYFQKVQKALELDSLVAYIDSLKKTSAKKNLKNERLNGFQEVFSKNNIDESKKWIKDILEKETSDEEEGSYNEEEKNRNYVNLMLKEHSYYKKLTTNLYDNYDHGTNQLKNIHFEKMKENLYYSTPLLNDQECSDLEDFRQMQFGQSTLNANHVDRIKPKINIQQNILPPIIKVKSERKTKKEKEAAIESINPIKNEGKLVITLSKNSIQPLSKTPDIIKAPRPSISVLNQSKASIPLKEVADKNRVKKGLTNEQCISRRKKLWQLICRKEIPRAFKQKLVMKKESCHNIKKLLKEFQRELKRMEMESQRRMKEQNMKAKKLAKEMMVLCRNKEKVEKEQRKKAEKEALEQKKIEVEMRETRRQNRKLNFLITQTELYAHFMAGKIAQRGIMADGSGLKSVNNILSHFDEENTPDDDYDSCQMKQQALSNVKDAIKNQINAQKEFDLMGPSKGATEEKSQPRIFKGTLKSYQLKGMNWLATLYDQGINGILADEMGLGKTVQTISFFAHLAEDQGTWGPFLIVAPASTLHNWQQEVTRFVPSFKVVPYWGTASDRKILRKIWNTSQSRKNPININGKDSSFHVLVTSYQLVVQDCKYFQQVNWHYMVLDEAQAIKSSASSRWKSLLEFKCRNRLLLTGTPIQNSMAELWSLLHFIMPTLFDCHTEFKEWFSKDIENHVEKHSSIDTQQLSRLHLILKPFMLRRIKKDVENELSEKIEIQLSCPLTLRQKLLYKAIKERISIDDLYQSSSSSSSSFSTTNLMNIFMQLRKVCNHPELFERKEVRSPYHFSFPLFYLPRLLFTNGLLESSKESLCTRLMFIFHPHHIHSSLFHSHLTHSSNIHSTSFHYPNLSNFSFTRFISLSPSELYAFFNGGMLERARHSNMEKCLHQLEACRHLFNTPCRSSFYIPLSHYETISSNTTTLIQPLSSSSSSSLVQQPSSLKTSVFETYPQEFCFVHPTNTIHTNIDHHVSSSQDQNDDGDFIIKNMSSSGVLQKDEDEDSEFKVIDITKRGVKKSSKHTYHLLPTYLPSFLSFYKPKVTSRGSSDHYTCDRRAEWQRLRTIDRSLNRPQYNYLLYGLHLQNGGSLCSNDNKKSLFFTNTKMTRVAINDTISNIAATTTDYTKTSINTSINTMVRSNLLAGTQSIATPILPPLPLGGIMGSPHHSFIDIPNKESLVVDAGKLTVLDKLLKKLKKENHRTLIYSQMTKVIDLLEEFLWLRKYTYIRLDGSSKISDRRDMVADFQSRSDIFVFLLSTRAGGIGINLTAADTVIFYDSDWNPTVDQQAMDRSHRLGQTKQVTVYRLICDGTIEERILQRAKEKSEIQRMVISGGSADVLRPKEMMSLLLDADEIDCKLTGMFEGQENLFLNRKRPYKSNRGRPSKKLCVDVNNIKKLNNNQNNNTNINEIINTNNDKTKSISAIKIT